MVNKWCPACAEVVEAGYENVCPECGAETVEPGVCGCGELIDPVCGPVCESCQAEINQQVAADAEYDRRRDMEMEQTRRQE